MSLHEIWIPDNAPGLGLPFDIGIIISTISLHNLPVHVKFYSYM